MTFDIASHTSRIEANRSIKDELSARLKEPNVRRRISVTDLLNPRKAFMQRAHPEIQPSLDRKQAMLAGVGFHDLFGHAVSSEEYLEQLVERDEIVGVIDIYKDIPTELKTTKGLESGEEFQLSRPSYIEQLAMYCAMVNKAVGRLILFDRGALSGQPSLSVYEATFEDLERIRREMRDRRDALTAALQEGRPKDLPRCAWLGRGCEFEPICGCADVSEFVPTIALSVPPLKPVPDEARELLNLLAVPRPRTSLRLHSLVFPRRAYYDALRQGEETDAERLESMDRLGQRKGLIEALRYGRGRLSVRKPVAFGDLRDGVTCYRDVPTLLRLVKLGSIVPREDLVEKFPHYFTRLAFECAVTDSSKGRLILYYERIREDDSKIMVYDVTFSDLDGIKAEANARLQNLKGVRGGQLDPKMLPACPAWMISRCPHHPTCGCG